MSWGVVEEGDVLSREEGDVTGKGQGRDSDDLGRCGGT